MHKITLTCRAQEIHWLTQNKEYTATSTYLLETVITDTRLSGRAAQLWQMLFSKARFDKDLSIRVSVAYLSQQMNRSMRQIQRYINSLIDNDYLIIENNHRGSGAQITNTYLVRFPTQHIEAAKAQASRAPRHQRVEQSQIKEFENLLIREDEEKDVGVWSNTTQIKRSKNRHDDVMGGGDINVVHNNTSNILNIKNNITNNKQANKKEEIVVDFESDKNKNSEKSLLLQAKLDEIKKRVNKTYQDFNQLHSADSSHALYDQLKDLSIQETALTLALTRLKREDRAKSFKQNLDSALHENAGFVQSQDGNRAITSAEFRNLRGQLTELSKQRDGLHVTTLMNEVTYAVRFGHLTIRRTDQKPMSIRHGFNIALKLIREGAWETPTDLKLWVETKIKKNQ